MPDPRAATKNRQSESPKMQEIEIRGPMSAGYAEILSPEALNFLAMLSAKFEERRLGLLEQRKATQEEIQQGQMPDFLVETAEIRASDWQVAPIPKNLLDRRVEITGPPDRKMIIDALNSGADVYRADFEDSNSPTWKNEEMMTRQDFADFMTLVAYDYID